MSVEAATAWLTGTWQGWLVTERGFRLINFDIRADGSFEVSAPSACATGILVVSDGRLRFDGTGPWPEARSSPKAPASAGPCASSVMTWL